MRSNGKELAQVVGLTSIPSLHNREISTPRTTTRSRGPETCGTSIAARDRMACA